MWRQLAKCLLPLLMLASYAAHAGSLRVGPTLVHLDAKQPVAVLRVTNNNSETTAFEARVVAWRQIDNQDVYADTSELIVTPPVFELAAGDSQIVRVGLLNAMPPATDVPESAFRVFIAELPAPAVQAQPRVQTLMRVGVPVFAAIGGAEPKLQWRMMRRSDGTWSLQVSNDGNAHARILKVSVQQPDGILAPELPGLYVLPSATRTWQLPDLISPRQQVSLRITSREGAQQIVLDPAVALTSM